MRFPTRIFAAALFAAAAFVSSAAGQAPPAKNEPAPVARVTQIDDQGLKSVLGSAGKPRVVNFWATWCAPCIEEFPDLVRISSDYGDKIEVVTISLDDAADKDGLVTDFLKRMKAEMPAYLLVSKDEATLISSVQPDWSGGLPFTLVYDAGGKKVYFKEGKFKADQLRSEIDKTLAPKP